MKASDFKPCAFCGQGVMHTGLPLCYRVRVERIGIDMREVNRSAGMEQFMGGNVALARIFHDPDIAHPIGDPVESLVCEKCALEPQILALLNEAKEKDPSQ